MAKRMTALLVLLLLLLLVGCAPSLVTKGRNLADEGQYDQAIETLYKELTTHPDNLRAWQELGVTFYKQGDLIKAEDALKKADKTDPRTHLYLGLVLEARQEYDYAIASYRAALTLQPSGKTRDMIRAHLDQLIRRQVDEQVAYAITHEAEIETAEIPQNTVAVTDFDGSQLPPETAPIAVGLAELTASDLAKVRSLRVVERMKLDVLLGELQLGQTGLVEPGQAPRMGKLLGSSRLVTGTVTGLGDDRIRLDGAIVSTVDSTTKVPEPSEGELRRFFEVQKNLVFKVIDEMGVELTAEERDAIRTVPTENYLAFLAYCRGLDYSRRGMYQAAESEFGQAVQLDPKFGAAQQQFQAAVALQSGPVTPQAMQAAADQMGPRTGETVEARLARLRWMATQADNTLSAPKVPPVADATGIVIIRGNLDGD